MDTVIKLDPKNGIKDKEYTIDSDIFNLLNKFNVLDCSTRFFFSSCHALETWFESSRVKLYRLHDLKGNKNYFARVSGTEVRVIEGLSYRR